MKILIRLWKNASIEHAETYPEAVEVSEEEIEALAIDKWRKTHPATEFPLQHWEIEAIIP